MTPLSINSVATYEKFTVVMCSRANSQSSNYPSPPIHRYYFRKSLQNTCTGIFDALSQSVFKEYNITDYIDNASCIITNINQIIEEHYVKTNSSPNYSCTSEQKKDLLNLFNWRQNPKMKTKLCKFFGEQIRNYFPRLLDIETSISKELSERIKRSTINEVSAWISYELYQIEYGILIGKISIDSYEITQDLNGKPNRVASWMEGEIEKALNRFEKIYHRNILTSEETEGMRQEIVLVLAKAMATTRLHLARKLFLTKCDEAFEQDQQGRTDCPPSVDQLIEYHVALVRHLYSSLGWEPLSQMDETDKQTLARDLAYRILSSTEIPNSNLPKIRDQLLSIIYTAPVQKV